MSSPPSNPITTRLSQITQFVGASLRPLPPLWGDGRYDSDVSPEGVKTGLVQDLTSQALRIPEDIQLIAEAVSTAFYQNGLLNDKKYLVYTDMYVVLTRQMEKIIQFVASLPSTSKLQGKLTAALITNLWNSLPHPPLSYVGDKYQYRDPEGRYNVIPP